VNSLDILKKTVEELEKQAEEIEKLSLNLLLNAPKDRTQVLEEIAGVNYQSI